MNPYLYINIKQKYWPAAPVGAELTKMVMSTLSHKSQSKCALAAAKMVGPLLQRRLSSELADKLKLTIKKLEEWIDDEEVTSNYRLEEIKADTISLYNYVYTNYSNYTYSALHLKAAESFITAVNVINNTYPTAFNVAKTTELAAEAEAYATSSYLEIYRTTFYLKWWDICYSLIQKEFQDKYDIFNKNINGDV